MARKRRTQVSSGSTNYRNPPQEHQFKPGQSGNPKGRPKGAFSARREQLEFFAETTTVTVFGQSKEVSRYRALLAACYQEAMLNDARASEQLLQMAERCSADEAAPLEELPEEDRAILDRAQRHQVARTQHAKSEDGDEEEGR